MSGNPNRGSYGILTCLALIVVGGCVLIWTPQLQHRWLTPRIVIPIWALAGIVAACVFLRGEATEADPYARGLAIGAGTVLLGLLALVVLILILCTGLVSGPMSFRA